MPELKKPVIAIVGPTATGKTRRAVDVARALGGEIISADSRQVYRGMDLGTGKDIEEYGEIKAHLLDVVDAGEKYNLYQFLSQARAAITDITTRGAWPVVCGGTGLYVESLLKGMILPQVPENRELRDSLEGKSLDELTQILAAMKPLHNVTDIDTAKRAVRAIEIQTYYLDHPDEAKAANDPQPLPAVVAGIAIDRDTRRSRITARLTARLENGMVDEVRRLLDSGIPAEDLIYYGLEYKYLTLYCIGQITYAQMLQELEIAIHQFAKRQMTWFRGMEKRGIRINWLPHDMPADEFVDAIKQLLL
ncbi:MAG: tRNA (adenosine(37)-N6)-dimethylallyltransferase MiaA [Muribaculaceae bacterium]|nr:tRNA (adenosine(37)-N6)-dimethylallyltransferase MiaA [Muribaculaceae bacterium]